jgi:hypothetical protein
MMTIAEAAEQTAAAAPPLSPAQRDTIAAAFAGFSAKAREAA